MFQSTTIGSEVQIRSVIIEKTAWISMLAWIRRLILTELHQGEGHQNVVAPAVSPERIVPNSGNWSTFADDDDEASSVDGHQETDDDPQSPFDMLTCGNSNDHDTDGDLRESCG